MENSKYWSKKNYIKFILHDDDIKNDTKYKMCVDPMISNKNTNSRKAMKIN